MCYLRYTVRDFNNSGSSDRIESILSSLDSSWGEDSNGIYFILIGSVDKKLSLTEVILLITAYIIYVQYLTYKDYLFLNHISESLTTCLALSTFCFIQISKNLTTFFLWLHRILVHLLLFCIHLY